MKPFSILHNERRGEQVTTTLNKNVRLSVVLSDGKICVSIFFCND